MPNPYAPQFEVAEESAGNQPKRPWLCTILALFSMFVYGAYAAFATSFGILIAIMGFGSARADERIITIAMFAATPVVIWLLVLEVIAFRKLNCQREQFLASLGMWFSAVPFALAALWFYEFTISGAVQLNAVPAAIAMVVGLIWLALTGARLKWAQGLATTT